MCATFGFADSAADNQSSSNREQQAFDCFSTDVPSCRSAIIKQRVKQRVMPDLLNWFLYEQWPSFIERRAHQSDSAPKSFNSSHAKGGTSAVVASLVVAGPLVLSVMALHRCALDLRWAGAYGLGGAQARFPPYPHPRWAPFQDTALFATSPEPNRDTER